MKKIIHLSDLHVGYDDCGERFRTMIDNITLLKQPASNYVILVTGDLAENANHPEFTEEAYAGVRLLETNGYTGL